MKEICSRLAGEDVQSSQNPMALINLRSSKVNSSLELLMTSGPVRKAFVHITGNCIVFPALFSVLAVSVLCVYVDFIHTALIQLN